MRTFIGKTRQAGQFDVAIDFCSFLSGLTNPLLTNFAPHLKEAMQENAIVCPPQVVSWKFEDPCLKMC
jgi:hypothetical protein